MKIVENWAESWRWISMQTAALVTVLNTSALAFPAKWAPFVQGASAVLGGMTMYGRLIQQAPQPTPAKGTVSE